MKQNYTTHSFPGTVPCRKVCPLPTLVLLAGFLLFTVVSWAGEGAFVLGNDALQLGRAASGIASPRSAYWSYFNPASIVELDRRVDVNWYTIRGNTELKPRGIIGNRFEDDFESDRFFNIPSAGVILPLETGTLGLGMYTPSGTGAEYGQSRNLLSRALNADRRLYYQHMRLVLAYGYQFENGWALGGGLHGSLSRFHSDHITLGLLPTAGDFEWDEALGAGFNLGVYKKWDRWAFGAAYSSRHWTQPFDKYRDLLRFSLDLPQILQAGIAYDLTPRVELTFDLKWINWEGIPAYANDVLEGGFNWRDQFCVKAGLEYQLNEKTRLMAGASHGNSPITEDHVFVAGLVPVISEDHLTVGVSRAINDQHEVHAAVIWGPPNTLRDTGRGDIFSILGRNSEITTGGASGVLGYTWKF